MDNSGHLGEVPLLGRLVQGEFQLHANKSSHFPETMALVLGYGASVKVYLYTYTFTADDARKQPSTVSPLGEK